jgi:hypothetical protein
MGTTATQWGGSALAILFTTVVLPEPEPPAIPIIVMILGSFIFGFYFMISLLRLPMYTPGLLRPTHIGCKYTKFSKYNQCFAEKNVLLKLFALGCIYDNCFCIKDN